MLGDSSNKLIKFNQEEEVEHSTYTNELRDYISTLQLMSSAQLEEEVKNSTQIIFKINEELSSDITEEIFPEYLKIKSPVLITFISTVGKNKSKIFWKFSDPGKFFSFIISDDIGGIINKICLKLLTGEIKNGMSGILQGLQHKTKLDLLDIGNQDGENLLIIAVKENRLDIVEKLLQNEFDVDYQDNSGDVAVDHAWLNYSAALNENFKAESIKIILSLLNANSTYPMSMEFGEAPNEIKDFIEMCEKVHDLVEDEDEEGISEKIKEYPNLCHFYNDNNKSVISCAIKAKKFIIFDLLISHGISPGRLESLEGIYRDLETESRRLIKRNQLQQARELPKVHILTLKINSIIGSNDRQHFQKWKYIEEAFKILDENEACSKILKLIAAYKKIKIVFDFKNDHVYYLNPTRRITTSATTNSDGTIYIGAKDLVDEVKKYKVIGAMAHEFCHLAVLIAFMNKFNPYPAGDSDQKKKYKVVFKECEKFSAIFKYFKDYVEPELERALNVFKDLQNKKQQIKFKDLTEPMRATVLHSEISFQGEETALYEQVGNDPDILNLLTSEDIRGILLDNKKLSIGCMCAQNSKYDIIERRFMEINQIFILADNAGAGKSTALSYITKKLKKNEKTHWVSFIKLREHKEIFKLSKSVEGDITLEDMQAILCKILRTESKTEVKIFEKLFKQNKVILLFDGVDEICPNFYKNFINFFRKLKNETKNRIWISTRPQHASKLERAFKMKAFKLVPYIEQEKKDYITNILKHFEINDYKRQSEAQKRLELFFENVEKNIKNQEYNNPLMIEIITELYAENKIDLTSDEINLFDIFDKIVYRQREQMNKKIEFGDQHLNSRVISFTLRLVYHVFALNFVHHINLDGAPNPNDLTIVKDFKIIRGQLTPEQIQRDGFLTVTLSEAKDKISSVDFTHTTYAEFFVAEFILSFAFNASHSIPKEDYEKISDLILNKVNDSSIIHKFLLSFVRNEKGVQNLNKEFKNFLVLNLKNSSNIEYEYKYHKLFQVFIILYRNLPEFSEMMEDILKTENIFQKIFNSKVFNNINELADLIETLENCWESNWYRHFRKDENNLAIPVNVGKLKKFDMLKKFLNFIEEVKLNLCEDLKKYTIEMILFKSKDLYNIDEKIWEELFLESFNLFAKSESDVIKYLVKLVDILKIENFPIECLHEKYHFIRHPLCKSIISKFDVDLINNEIRKRDQRCLMYPTFKAFLEDNCKSHNALTVNFIIDLQPYCFWGGFKPKNIIECLELLEDFSSFPFELANFHLILNERDFVKKCYSQIHKLSLSKLGDPIAFKKGYDFYKKYDFKNYKNDFIHFFNLSTLLLKMTDKNFPYLKKLLEELLIPKNGELDILDFVNDDFWNEFDAQNVEIFLKMMKNFACYFYENDMQKVMKFMRKILFDEKSLVKHSFPKIVKLNGLSAIETVKAFYHLYKEDWKELQEMFINLKNLPVIFSELTEEIYPSFSEIVKLVFASDKDKIFDCINEECWEGFDEEKDKTLFDKLVKDFSSCFFEGDAQKSNKLTDDFRYFSLFHEQLRAIKKSSIRKEEFSDNLSEYESSINDADDFLYSESFDESSDSDC